MIGWRQETNQTEDECGAVPCNRGLDRVVGGVELSIKFAHYNDRDRVVHVARGMGWSPVDLEVEDDDEWQSDGK